MDAINAMLLDLCVARHKREVGAAFAALRKEWEAPKKEPSALQRLAMQQTDMTAGAMMQARQNSMLLGAACSHGWWANAASVGVFGGSWRGAY